MSSSLNPHRRNILKAAAGMAAAVSLPAASYAAISGSNEKLRGAVIGIHGRGRNHITGHGEHVKAICDCDQVVLGKRFSLMSKVQDTQNRVKTFQDYRKLLEVKDIDFVSIATPNHLHSIMGIEAAMAGKHVYVEKPVSHNVWEGRQLAKAQEKYGVVIQCGTQSRSSPSLQKAVQLVREGKIGKVQYAIGTCFKPRKSIGKRSKPLSIAKTLDYDLWCGPAEKRELFREKLHYDWHWDFNTGNGDMGNQGIHQMDIARWFLGYDTISPRVISIGGRLGYEDAGDTPNTQTVIHDYAGAPLIFETRGLPSKKEFQDKRWGKSMDNYRGSRIGVIIQGDQGYVLVPSYTQATFFDADGNQTMQLTGGGDHYKNFREAVEANDPSKLNGPILEGHLSSALCHTGGLSHQLGEAMDAKEIMSSLYNVSKLFVDSTQRLVDHLNANEIQTNQGSQLIRGAELKFDVEKEICTNHEKANQMMSREYRKGFEVKAV